jgi:hypothetical protein
MRSLVEIEMAVRNILDLVLAGRIGHQDNNKISTRIIILPTRKRKDVAKLCNLGVSG